LKTETNIKSAFSQHAYSYFEFLNAAKRAENSNPGISKLFKSLAESEKIVAQNLFVLISGETDFEQNIMNGIDDLTYQTTQFYPTVINQAEMDASAREAAMFRATEKVGKNLTALLKNALDNPYRNTPFHICGICGNVTMELPNTCTVCSSTSDKFIRIE